MSDRTISFDTPARRDMREACKRLKQMIFDKADCFLRAHVNEGEKPRLLFVAFVNSEASISDNEIVILPGAFAMYAPDAEGLMSPDIDGEDFERFLLMIDTFPIRHMRAIYEQSGRSLDAHAPQGQCVG